MSNTRTLPLRDIAKPGRFGADKGLPGVEISIQHPLSLVMVIARKNKSKTTQQKLDSLIAATVMWAGPDQWLVQAIDREDGALLTELQKKLGDMASVVDQSHGRVVINVGGIRARDVLGKGTPVDLHGDVFPVGKSALTQMAHVGVHITRTGQNEFTLSVFRGFAESFWEWLCTSAAEFGYQVR